MCLSGRSGSRENGFILIELLIGVTILGLLMSLIVMTFSGTFGAIEMIDAGYEIDRQARLSLAMMAEELMMARPHPAFPFMGKDGVLGGYADDVLAFVSKSRDVSSQGAPVQPGSIRVVYARDGDRVTRLVLRHLYGIVPEPIERVDIAFGVVAFNVRYYDGTAEKWVNEWDGVLKKALPRVVMMELTFADTRNELRTFSDLVIISSQAL
ncbi:MAG: hypothetical protein OJF52_001942 [Nitrospira sp.]|jgi:hypothetical protein|nr:MAG: hypothetical protein OJF52_001942 [Nitrospira sp.]